MVNDKAKIMNKSQDIEIAQQGKSGRTFGSLCSNVLCQHHSVYKRERRITQTLFC